MAKTRKNSKTWLIVQYDDRPIDKFDSEFMRRNEAYAKKYGYKYKFVNKGYTDLPPYWRKVALVKKLLDTDQYKGILWLDTDAVIFNVNISLDSVGDKLKHFVKATNSSGNQIFNAGVWTVKGTDKGKKIMKKWMDMYDPSAWKYEDNHWKCDHAWAGDKYEQGSFAYKIVPQHSANINTTHEPFLQGQYKNHANNEVFIYHFFNHFKSRREAFINENPFPI